MSTATNDEIKLSLTEILTKQYTSTVTFLFDNESISSSSSSSIAMQTKDSMQTNESKQKTISNDIKSLNCTKLSLQIVKALPTSSSTTSNDSIDAIDGGDTNDRVNINQLSTNDFQANIKLNGNGNLILLDVSYNPAIGQGSAASIQSIGQLLHAIFTESSSSADSTTKQIKQQRSSVVSEESDIVENSNRKGGKDLRIAKVRRSQIDTLFSTLVESGEYPISICRLLSDLIELSQSSSTTTSSNTSNATTIQEIIRELELMVNTPQIYLYNQSQDFYTDIDEKFKIGQGYYGRVNELTDILKIANGVIAAKETLASQDISKEKQDGLESQEGGINVDVVFISGSAGSGKSKLVQFVSDYLENMGCWMTLHIKFKRGLEYESKLLLSSLFEKLVTNLITMKNGKDEKDRVYAERAISSIQETLDPYISLYSLSEFVPSLQLIIPAMRRNSTSTTTRNNSAEADMSHWQLVFLLVALLQSIIKLDRHIMFCLDDLQWCDATTLSLIREVLVGINGPFLCIGMYRDNEIDESHPFANELDTLQKANNVNLTEINLPSLSRDDVTDMIMSELRLPRRLVYELADVVHKKTSGHALFVIQFLSALVHDSAIAYSPMKHRFDWDVNKISALQMGDDVASLIVSNLSYLEAQALQSLRILSCFGTSSELCIFKILDNASSISPGEGIESFLPDLVDRGVIELSGSRVTFTHDLIQKNVYDNIDMNERGKLHRDMANCLASLTSLDAATQKSSIQGGIDHLYLSDTSSSLDEYTIKPSTLIQIATEQINAAGSSFITDKSQRIRYASWNVVAGKQAMDHSNFQMALFNYKNGTAFISGEGLWVNESTYELCLKLHEGAAYCSFALGKSEEVILYANAIIDNVSFEDSLLAQDLMLKALRGSGELGFSDDIARGIAVLRMLKFDIPATATPATVIQAIQETGKITSQYTIESILKLKQTNISVNARKRHIFSIVNTITLACYRQSSPYLPLIACAMVQYSLSNGVLEESATAFVVYGFFLVYLQNDFDEARRWAEIAEKILDPQSSFTPLILYGFLTFLFKPHREMASALHQAYQCGMKVGDVQSGTYAKTMSIRLSFFGGEHLRIVSEAHAKSLPIIAKYNQENLKYAVIDCSLVDSLTGIDTRPYSAFQGTIINEEILLAHCRLKKIPHGVDAIFTNRYMAAFWRGDYTEANKCYDLASAQPTFNMPRIQMISTSLYRGLISFQLFRAGEGEDWLAEGKKMLNKMELWTKNCSKDVYENKLYLLEAENYASDDHIVAAKESYELSITSGRDNGLIHEQGLASECYGKFLSSVCETDESNRWYQAAIKCYKQWGAHAKADQLKKEQHPDTLLPREEISSGTGLKHDRDEDVNEEMI